MDVMASGGAGANNCRLDWQLDFDDVANTVTINATHTHFDGSAAPDPQTAQLILTLNNVKITLDLKTARLSTGQLFDGNSASMLNSGSRTRTGVRATVSADRASLIEFSTTYLPPA